MIEFKITDQGKHTQQESDQSSQECSGEKELREGYKGGEAIEGEPKQRVSQRERAEPVSL